MSGWWPFARSPFDFFKRAVLWLFAGFVMLSGYGLTKLEPYGPPQLLPLTSWDVAIPFIPWTIWFYGTASYAALIAFLQAPDRLACRRLFFAVAAAACACWVFFAFFPTTYPRELYPLPDHAETWFQRVTYAEFADLRDSDTPSNCLPSQHVALAWSLGLTWMSFLRGRFTRYLPIAWAIVVTICTLTTKQHYLWDVPSGFIVGAGAAALVQWGITAEVEPFWARRRSVITVSRESDIRAIRALRERVEAHQWRLADIPWPAGPLPALTRPMVRLLNHVIYIEEIAGLNFQLLRDAAASDDLRTLYQLFADEERRHADGLRHILTMHGAALQPPGMGNGLVLDQFDRLDARLDADAVLVAASNPVFETFLDAGTVPFLQGHPDLRGPALDEFIERVSKDEAAHLAVNWLVTRNIARNYQGVRGWRLLVNPNIWRGMIAVPFMSLDVYALAYRLGFDFRTLLPAFARLFRLHQRYPELTWFPPWLVYRVFCYAGAVATLACIGLDRLGVLWGRFWTTLTRGTDQLARAMFGRGLLQRRGLPAIRVRQP